VAGAAPKHIGFLTHRNQCLALQQLAGPGQRLLDGADLPGANARFFGQPAGVLATYPARYRSRRSLQMNIQRQFVRRQPDMQHDVGNLGTVPAPVRRIIMRNIFVHKVSVAFELFTLKSSVSANKIDFFFINPWHELTILPHTTYSSYEAQSLRPLRFIFALLPPYLPHRQSHFTQINERDVINILYHHPKCVALVFHDSFLEFQAHNAVHDASESYPIPMDLLPNE
jgi:hypothetical protein